MAKKPEIIPPMKVDKLETSPRLGGLHSRREAFKPASHFNQVRGYEHAVPKQKCKVRQFYTPYARHYTTLLIINRDF